MAEPGTDPELDHGETPSIAALLEAEHHEIDDGIETFLEGLARGELPLPQLARAGAALRRHIYLEEEFLFPPLRAAGMLAPVLVMLREHGEIWQTLDAIDDLDGATDPDGLRERCRELLDRLAEHNAKEEPIIYPRGDAVLDAEQTAELLDYIDSGELPEGWVCAQA
ncbi:hemerythrin domain-containing protein [Nocardioides sp.]|uniref:hemerythrin domain-containing protein n=1 Tax=Nocardioides sp. TaxID=35761 RepID=UPI002638EDD0|nr:hemerythrin domain-containing protein [Nocardioides sp.]MDI6912071.1 hemerythrin domain-containing protein [Nocardioides sp.]